MRNKLKKALLITTLAVGAVGFTGCSTTPEQRNMYTCIGFTEALNLATVNVDKLSVRQVEVIHQAALAAKPVCGEGEVPTDDKVKQEVLKRAGDAIHKVLDQVGVQQ